MEKIINKGGEFYFADFGYISLGVYKVQDVQDGEWGDHERNTEKNKGTGNGPENRS